MNDSTSGHDVVSVTVTVGESTKLVAVPAPASKMAYATKAKVTVKRADGQMETAEWLVRGDGSVTIDFPPGLVNGDTVTVEFT